MAVSILLRDFHIINKVTEILFSSGKFDNSILKNSISFTQVNALHQLKIKRSFLTHYIMLKCGDGTFCRH